MRRGGQRRRYWSRSWLRPERRRQLVYMINCCRNAFANIPCLILHAPVDVRSVFCFSVMHSVRILIVRYVFVCCLSLIRRHLACWTETMRYMFVTGTFQPVYVRYMYVRRFGFSTGLTFLPPDNKNSYPFHVRRFNPCDRGFNWATCVRWSATDDWVRYTQESMCRVNKGLWFWVFELHRR